MLRRVLFFCVIFGYSHSQIKVADQYFLNRNSDFNLNVDPFEYFKQLVRDTQTPYRQCETIPPYKVQLDKTFFNVDFRYWKIKYPPPPFRTLEAFVQFDTYRQSTFFSHSLQGFSQEKVPGLLYFYLSSASQLHSLRQLGLLTGIDAVQSVRYAFESNEVVRVPWYRSGPFINLERPFSIYTNFSSYDPQTITITDLGVGPPVFNDYTTRFFQHFNREFNVPPRLFKTYDEYFQALLQTWQTRLRPDQDEMREWGMKQFDNLLQYGEGYFPLPYLSVPIPPRTTFNPFNLVFPYANLIYEYHKDPNYYRFTKVWWLNETEAEHNQNSLLYVVLPDHITREVVLPNIDQTQWTGPYRFCPNPNNWLVASIEPIWAVNHFQYKNDWFKSNKRYRYAGVTNVELAYAQLNVDQCPGERSRNLFAGTAACDQNANCNPVGGIQFKSGGYECTCRNNFRYPSNIRSPFRPAFDRYPVSPVCQPISLLTPYPSWQTNGEQIRLTPLHNIVRRSVRPNLFEKLRAIVFNRTSVTCPPWSHIGLFYNIDTDYDDRFISDLSRHLDIVYKPFTLQAVRIAHLLSSYLQLYRPNWDPVNDGFEDRRPDPPLFEHVLESEISSTGLAYSQLLEVGIYFNGSEYERQNPYQQFGYPSTGGGGGGYNPRYGFNINDNSGTDERENERHHENFHFQRTNFGYNTKPFQEMSYAITFLRLSNGKYIINRTLDGSHLALGTWYDKAMLNGRVDTSLYSVSMAMRRDSLGTQLLRLPQVQYISPTAGIWFGPYHDCSLKSTEASMLRMRYSVPIVKEVNRLPIGFVSVVIGSDLRWYKINPCDESIGLNAYNPFQSIHKCNRETTRCIYQDIPEQESGYDLASYKCVCKQGYEYPFLSYENNYFEGAMIEREFEKMMKGEINSYENMKCRQINDRWDTKYGFVMNNAIENRQQLIHTTLIIMLIIQYCIL
ncbi:unnamed protein product [Didymodactylos carnosus]|uniref:GPR158/179 extracellular domain-containing protein n=1 Tax=Didymodactylos carnosus TaxID=1234261 RepID=A0A813RUT0_9BILA|nr:unnamed protein product [Didymodactylos carnosus]CAF0786258.1 unnamed protein product [Didymodactylos carnosus]CAF3511844.1 unnamed protein product [Didymodactylos carnosus]CAF3570033.1 unnamed protein product [Didymodactylos carnosus]